MLIQIAFPDNRFDYVKEDVLDTLIASGAITRFKRRAGWVTLGVDPVRAARREYNAQWSEELRILVRNEMRKQDE